MSKYSLKNIVLGIGIGMVIASFVNLNSGIRHLTVEELEREAERYNLRLIKKTEIEVPGAEATPTPTPTPVAEADKNDQQPEFVDISIKQGYTSYIVADELLKNNLISSKTDFINRMDALQKSNKLQVGSFRLQRGSSIELIIEIITTAPGQ